MDGTRGVRECRCLKEQLSAQCLPLRFRSARLLDFSGEVGHAAAAWLGDPGDGVFITGGVGRGKTHLVCGLAFELAKSGKTVLFRKAAELYRELRAAFSGRGDERTVFETYGATPILVLDDIGAGGLTDFERRVLLEIIDSRGDQFRPTLVTSNWNLEQISQAMDDRVASRLAGYCQIKMCGNDQRVAGKAA
jgi:DNA replication protein DnaC